uniref:Uncharacterized protein n=1 Tax=Amphimedon queenslandica TaxID=400682 RepID=A0A1X7SIL0_AMPQE
DQSSELDKGHADHKSFVSGKEESSNPKERLKNKIETLEAAVKEQEDELNSEIQDLQLRIQENIAAANKELESTKQELAEEKEKVATLVQGTVGKFILHLKEIFYINCYIKIMKNSKNYLKVDYKKL